MAFQDSAKAVFFSATMRLNSLRSRGASFGLESAMRVTRWATTCGTASASSAALMATEWDARRRRVAMSSFTGETATVGLCRLTFDTRGADSWGSYPADPNDFVVGGPGNLEL